MSQSALWQSPLDLEAIFNRQGPPAYPFYDERGQLFWLESLVAYKGRLALVHKLGDEIQPITPKEYQVRTAVHEYGGQAFCYVEDAVIFNNYDDGGLYMQDLPHASGHERAIKKPLRITKDISGQIGFADICVNQPRRIVLAVQERIAKPENINCLSVIELQTDGLREPQIIESGADFYCCPSICADGTKIAWVQWNHPNMPWDESAAYIADLNQVDDRYQLTNKRLINGGANVSICQLGFLQDGSLAYAKDGESKLDSPTNFWNLYTWNDGEVNALTSDLAEYGDAHWVFGQKRWVQSGPDSLIAIRTRQGRDELVQIVLNTKRVSVLGDGFARLAQLSLSPDNSKVCAVAHYADREPSVLQLKLPLQSGANVAFDIRHSIAQELSEDTVSIPQLTAFATADGEQAMANYYRPQHPTRSYTEHSAVPAIVMVHGGPTSRADQSLAMLVQFFTSSGFAVIDVNHRGSTGLGRHYRQKLLGQWGEIDAADIKDAVNYFVQAGLVHPDKVCIRGGSAGGYAVLRALTRYPDLFSVGACYYGIGNLITLSEITHKFESRYTDQLIGEQFDPTSAHSLDSRFTQRSPIFEMDKIKSPVILFQGLDDKVVPPAVSREVVKVLQQGAIEHEYIEYEREGHGFRQAQTRVDALSKEMAFYQRILSRVDNGI